MGTKIEAVPDYPSYVKCGEILKSPFQNYKNSIILKCFHCNEVHFFLESFVAHIQEHFKDILSLDEYDTKTQHEHVHEDGPECERILADNLTIKLEEIDDPLFPVKCELKEEKDNEKNTPVLDTSIEKNNLFEGVCESSDEFQPDDDAESDEDYVIKETKVRKRKNSIDDSESDEDEIRENSIKRNIKLSPIVDDFMKSKSNVLKLIELYKNQPDLWDKYSPYYRQKDKKKTILEDITLDLNKACTLKLSRSETEQIISYIYKKYHDDFKRIHYQCTKKKKTKKSNKKSEKDDQSQVKNLQCCWFYDSLHFLRSNDIIRLENLDSNLNDLTSEQIIKLLEIYQGIPNLWNTYLIENICTNKRQEALSEMLNTMEKEMNIKVDTYALEKYLHTIHEYYSRERRKLSGIPTADDLKDSLENNSINYFEHMSFLEDNEGPFNCPECNGIFNKPLYFRIHKSTHDGTMPLKCSQCDQEFKTVSSYTTHAKRHFEDLQYICKECNKKFLKPFDLKLHLLSHTEARPYCCEICGASYRYSHSFKKHQRQHEKRFTHTCDICSKGYYSKHRYVDHMNSHMNIRKYICNICGKGFITSRALKTHGVTHEDSRNHACEICGKTFKLKIGVLQHMRTHGSKAESEKNSLV